MDDEYIMLKLTIDAIQWNCPESSEVECEKSETKTDTSEMTEVKWDITENEMQLKTDTSEMTEVKWDTTE